MINLALFWLLGFRLLGRRCGVLSFPVAPLNIFESRSGCDAGDRPSLWVVKLEKGCAYKSSLKLIWAFAYFRGKNLPGSGDCSVLEEHEGKNKQAMCGQC